MLKNESTLPYILNLEIHYEGLGISGLHRFDGTSENQCDSDVWVKHTSADTKEGPGSGE